MDCIAVGPPTMRSIEINAADNGFVLRYCDPEVEKRNREDEGWQDPWRSRVYETPEALATDLTKLLPLMKQYNAEKDEAMEYKTALHEAFTQGTD